MFPILVVAQLPHTNSSCLSLQWLSIVLGFYCQPRPGPELVLVVEGGGEGNNESGARGARGGDTGRCTMRALEHHQTPLNEGWVLGARSCQPAPTSDNISYLVNISMEFHCGPASGREPNVNIYFHYRLNVTENCQLRAKPRPERQLLLRRDFSTNLTFENERWIQPAKSKNPLRRLVLSYNFQTTNYYMKASLCRYNGSDISHVGTRMMGGHSN